VSRKRQPAGPSTSERGARTRLPRGAEKRARKSRGHLDPSTWREEILASERGTIFKDAPLRIALCYPLPYHAAMSSLGYQVIYRLLNAHDGIACERVVLPDDVRAARARGQRPVAIESGRPLADFDLVAFSLTWDLDIVGFFDLLDLAGIPLLRDERGPYHPAVLIGGPLTASNPLPFSDFIDFAVIGDGEDAVPRVAQALTDARDRDDLFDRLAPIPGMWLPERDGDRIPATQKVALTQPAVSQIVTPLSELSNMFLVEGSRGCPRFCKFCLVRAAESPMRQNEVRRVMAAIPPWAERVGFVGAAISEWDGIREAMREVVASGRGIGISSLRADRLDSEFVELLYRGGARSLTIAARYSQT
jgi:hypothetical protein